MYIKRVVEGIIRINDVKNHLYKEICLSMLYYEYNRTSFN